MSRQATQLQTAKAPNTKNLAHFCGQFRTKPIRPTTSPPPDLYRDLRALQLIPPRACLSQVARGTLEAGAAASPLGLELWVLWASLGSWDSLSFKR